ncbi:MAG: NUDIX hydrolase [Thermoleophilia bacterium]|nr:NUDIX hydrolase [Thermoleophilia bacterium]
MHVDEAALAPLRARFGEPRLLELELEISARERELVEHSTRRGRHHDVTFFVISDGRVALIQKPHYEPGLWRPPGGGLKPGEDFVAGARREALEELGVDVELRRYLVRTEALFTCGEVGLPWSTHVFSATTASERLEPLDTHEISAARWGTFAELAGPIRERLLATGHALWRYRVALHDAALDALREE